MTYTVYVPKLPSWPRSQVCWGTVVVSPATPDDNHRLLVYTEDGMITPRSEEKFMEVLRAKVDRIKQNQSLSGPRFCCSIHELDIAGQYDDETRQVTWSDPKLFEDWLQATPKQR